MKIITKTLLNTVLLLFLSIIMQQNLYAQKKIPASTPANLLENPAELVVAIGHTKVATVTISVEKPLQEYLSKKLGRKVRVYYPETIFELMDKLESGEIHVADFNPFGYVLASNEDKIEVLAMRGKETGELEMYNSCLIVNAKSSIKTKEDLKKQKGNLHVSFVDAMSTSGHLVPRLYLKSLGIQTESFFKEITFSKSHIRVIEAVAQNIDFIGGCSLQTLQGQIKEGKVKAEDIRVIWTSPDIPHGPVAMQKNLSESLKNELREAYLKMYEDKVLWQIVQDNWKSKTAIFMKGSDAAFDGLRKITNADDDLTFILNFYRD